MEPKRFAVMAGDEIVAIYNDPERAELEAQQAMPTYQSAYPDKADWKVVELPDESRAPDSAAVAETAEVTPVPEEAEAEPKAPGDAS